MIDQETGAIPFLPKWRGAALSRDPRGSGVLFPEAYTSAEIFQRERESIFFRSWKYVAHVSELPSPGSFVTTSLVGQNLLLIRGNDEIIRGFFNVCQHRGHELLSGSGKVPVIRCPYHAWTYDLSGHLRSAPHAGDAIRCKNVALSSVRVEDFCGFLFANLDHNAASLRETAIGLEDEIRQHVPELDSLRKVGAWSEEREANWKLVIENDIECYHCHVAHPYLSSRLRMDEYRSIDHEVFTTHIIPQDAEKGGSGNHPSAFLYWYLWPDTEARVMPGPSNFAIYTMEPLGPTRTRLHYHHFVGESVSSAEIAQIRHDPEDDPTVAEDVALVESVQRGLGSLGYRGSAFVVNEESVWSEHSVHHFQCLIADALAVPTAPDDILIGLTAPGDAKPTRLVARRGAADELWVRTPSPLAPGTNVVISISAPSGMLQREARVVRSEAMDGTLGMLLTPSGSIAEPSRACFATDGDSAKCKD